MIPRLVSGPAWLAATASALVSFSMRTAAAQEAPPPKELAKADAPPPPHPGVDTAVGTLTAIGYLEALYSYNFNEPSNGITNLRGFDNRHNSFTMSNVALGGTWEKGPVFGKVVLQVGATPSTYYLAEPTLAGSGGANATSAELWKYVQEANGGVRIPVGNRALVVSAGLFLSPIGDESIAVKDNWNWSRSNLFFGLPFYHAGARVAYEATDQLTLTIHVYNGWNSVVDNNDGKSIAASATYEIDDAIRAQVLYFGGPERARGAAEGPAWRHLVDAFATVDAHPRFSFRVHGNVGFESNRLGTHAWQAGALYARAKALDVLYVAARGDLFRESAPTNAATGATSSAVFWPSEWVSSVTGTLELRPHDQVSLRLEYRHDQAQGAAYFKQAVSGDGTAAVPYVPNASGQDTVLAGLTTWF